MYSNAENQKHLRTEKGDGKYGVRSFDQEICVLLYVHLKNDI